MAILPLEFQHPFLLDVARDQITELLLQKRRQQLREALRDTLLQRAWAEGDLRRENL